MKIRWPIRIYVDNDSFGAFVCVFTQEGECTVTNWHYGNATFEGSRTPLRPTISTAMRLARKIKNRKVKP